MRFISLSAVFAVALLAAGTASEAIDPGAMIADRAAKLKEMGSAFKGMNDELRHLDPDMKIVRNDAKLLRAYSTQLPEWFPAGTGTESGIKTRAKPDVWEKAAAFAAAAKSFQTEAANLQKLVADTDIDAVKLQAKSVAATCGACHTEFRTAD